MDLIHDHQERQRKQVVPYLGVMREGLRTRGGAVRGGVCPSELGGEPEASRESRSNPSEWLLSKTHNTWNVGEDMEKLELLYIAGENGKWSSQYGKQHGGSSKN